MIRPDAEIQVVLYPDNPHVEAEAERYRNFFGSRISEQDIMRLTVPEYVGKLKTKRSKYPQVPTRHNFYLLVFNFYLKSGIYTLLW